MPVAWPNAILHPPPRMWLFTINVQQTVNSKNKNKQAKNTKSWPNWWEHQDKRHNGMVRSSLKCHSSEHKGLSNSNKCRFGRPAREQKCGKEEEVRTRSRCVVVENSQGRRVLWSSGMKYDIASPEGWTRFRPGLLAPLWPQPECEKGHKEWSPGMFSRLELISKNWAKNWITENTLMFRLRLVTLNSAVMHLSPDYRTRINELTHGWLRLTWQLLLHCPVICWVHKKPAYGI